MAELQENAIEWFSGNKLACITLSQKKYINKVLRLAEETDQVNIVARNSDGTICAHIPVSWIKINPPRQGRVFTDEEKAETAERLKLARQNKQNNG